MLQMVKSYQKVKRHKSKLHVRFHIEARIFGRLFKYLGINNITIVAFEVGQYDIISTKKSISTSDFVVGQYAFLRSI